MKTSVSLTVILSVSLITMLSVICVYQFGVLPETQKQMKKSLYEKIKSAAVISKPVIEKAIKSKDDIMLLSQINSISKVEDVSMVYLLDSSGRVITHNNTSEWGKTYSDETNKKALTAADGASFSYKPAKGYLFATQLVSSTTLCIGISSERMKASLQAAQKRYLASGLLIVFLSMLLIGAVAEFKIRRPFRQFYKMLDSIISGTSDRVEIKTNDEFEKLSLLVNRALAGSKTAPDGMQMSYDSLLSGIGVLTGSCILLIGNDNKLSFISAAAAKELKLADENKGKHILDVSDSIPFLAELVKKAAENPGQAIQLKASDRQAKALLTDTGTIILL